MTTMAYSPSSSSIMSYRPTSPLSRPDSPLSQHTYSRSTSPYPYPYPAHGHTNKSKSISSIPTHSIHRLTNSFSYQYDQPGPSTFNTTLSRSSSFKHKSKSNFSNDTKTLSRASSIRSNRSKTISPSKLPSINSVSYFPPFEVMGSNDSEQDSDSTSTSTSTSDKHNDESSQSPTPIDRPTSPSRTYRGDRKTHQKGKSLSSIANIMTASISWSLSSLSCTPSPSLDPIQPQYNDHIDGLPRDVKVVEALTKRFNTSSNCKRRVLEPFTLSPLDLEVENKQMILDQPVLRSGSMHKRRMKSEIEVDLVLSRSSSLGGRSGMRDSIRGRKRDDEKRVGDEDLVENLLIQTPSRPPTSTRRTRPNLRLPIPTLPNWRFPLGPSPPITSLSPDIPLEAFSHIIENPCLTPSRLTFSPLRIESSLPLLSPGIEDEVEIIDSELSPSPSPTSLYGPSTPPKEELKDEISIKRLSPSLGHWSINQDDIGLGLKRIGSRTSEMSCETIKQDNGWLDVTPKPSKIVKRVEGGLTAL